MARIRRNKKNRKGWSLFASLMFLAGFFGIHTILLKNLVLEPMGLMNTVHIWFLKLSPGEMTLNAFDFVWGALIWHGVKQAVL
jgi:hypothetical protein